MITIYRVSTIMDMNEVTAHQLELVVTPFRIRKQQNTAARLAQASLTGSISVPSMNGDGHQQHAWAVSHTFSQPSNPAATKILMSIKACVREVGINRQELQVKHRGEMGAGMVDETFEHLAMEGHVYTTSDQHHFKSTDA